MVAGSLRVDGSVLNDNLCADRTLSEPSATGTYPVFRGSIDIQRAAVFDRRPFTDLYGFLWLKYRKISGCRPDQPEQYKTYRNPYIQYRRGSFPVVTPADGKGNYGEPHRHNQCTGDGNPIFEGCRQQKEGQGTENNPEYVT